MPAIAQEIEYDLIEVLDLIVGEKRKIVIISMNWTRRIPPSDMNTPKLCPSLRNYLSDPNKRCLRARANKKCYASLPT